MPWSTDSPAAPDGGWTTRAAAGRAIEVVRADGIRGLVVKGLGEIGYRRMEVFEHSLAEPLAPRRPTGVRFTWLDEDTLDAYGSLGEGMAPDAAAEALAAGHRCLIGLDAETVVYASWVGTGRVSIDYLGVDLVLAPDAALVHRVVTAPQMRGRGVALAAGVVRERWLATQGLRRSISLVVPRNDAGLALVRSVGFRSIGTVAAVGPRGRARIVFRPGPGATPPGCFVPPDIAGAPAAWPQPLRRRRWYPTPIKDHAGVRLARWILAAGMLALARLVVARRNPFVVVVAGSVGKTTTKTFLAEMLRTRYRVGATHGNFNHDIGAAVTVLGARHDERPLRQTVLALRSGATALSGRGRYPEVLVIEMGARVPGDLERATRSLRPHMVVLTTIRNAHRGNYPTAAALVGEKTWPLRRLHRGGTAVLNVGDAQVAALAGGVDGRVVRFGSSDAEVRLVGVHERADGLSARIAVADGDGSVEEWPFETPLLGVHQLDSVLGALAAARALGVPVAAALAAAERLEAPLGRGRMLAGSCGRRVLDYSGNASMQAMVDAITVLRRMAGPHTAVLAGLHELGPDTDAAHRTVGTALAPWADRLVAVGPGGETIASAAREHGLDPDRIVVAPDAATAVAATLAGAEGGTVLVNGIRAAGLERVVAALTRPVA